jgi:hypothetical protein
MYVVTAAKMRLDDILFQLIHLRDYIYIHNY